MLRQGLAGHLPAMTAKYRTPTAAERAEAVAVLRAVLAHATPGPAGLPLRVSPATDDTGHPCTLVTDTAHGWGSVLLRTSSDLLVEVPHPGSDRFTARLGLDLFHAVPTAALLVAGTHRNQVDVAHRADSLFHAFAQTLALPELQLHGFAAETAPGIDAVVSAGVGEQGELHRQVEKALTQQGFSVGHHERLAGRTNAQGIAAAASGRTFLHLELAPALRDRRRDAVVGAVAAAVAKAVAETRYQQRDQHPDRGGTRRDEERDAETGR